MILVPFTGVNNHHKCVSFGTGLLSKEDVPSYKWLLNAFLNTHAKAPIVVVTDEDPSMKQAVDQVLTETIHRFCMWHIMSKLGVKLGATLCYANSPFTQRLRSIVWNENIHVQEFERKWNQILIDFNIEDHNWLSKMYKMRDQWVPAYFRETPMSGLMKTTSLSEGQNNFYNHFLSTHSTLIEFFFRFESALDSQRNMQRTLDYNSRTKRLSLKTELPIEEHASNIFTLKIFEIVQDEIYKSLVGVISTSCSENEGTYKYIIKEIGKNVRITSPIEVVFVEHELTITCSCLKFERFGILCRHAFLVLRSHEVNEIPSMYINKRWTKDIFTLTLATLQHGEQRDHKKARMSEGIIRSMYEDLAYCLRVLGCNEDDLKKASEQHHNLIMELTSGRSTKGGSKHDIIEEMVGVAQPDLVEIHPPVGIRNKGCGTSKRLISEREKAISKTARKCKTCNKTTKHDSRNCPEKDRVNRGE